MGVLSSTVHIDWGIARSSTMRTDPRYTPSSAFDTFPWPEATNDQRERIDAFAHELIAVRSALCAEHVIGLTRSTIALMTARLTSCGRFTANSISL